MSEKNKFMLERANAAMAQGDYEAFLAHCIDDVLWTLVGDRTLEGKETVRRYIRSTYVQPPRFSVDQLIADEEFLIALGDIHSQTKAASSCLRRL